MKQEVYTGQVGSTRGAFVLLSFALAVFVGTAHAQSGRRLPNRSEPPAETASAPPKPAEQPSQAGPDKPKQQLVVTRSLNDSFSSYYSDLVTRACLDRLKEGASATVSAAREMNRKEASDFAKNSTDTHVLWIEWDYDRMGSSQSDPSQTNSYINFVLFSPGTGKIKTSGRVHPGDYRNRTSVGGVGIPMPIPNSAAALEFILKESGKEIADRVISSLNIGRPNH